MGYLKRGGFFDDVIVNDNLDEAYCRLKGVLVQERLLEVKKG
tara:strand:+ start:130 stop:255 length:126 start_codon:yes stop_codon:yes gene_type:complete